MARSKKKIKKNKKSKNRRSAFACRSNNQVHGMPNDVTDDGNPADTSSDSDDTSSESDGLRGLQLDSCLQPVDIASNLSQFEDVIFNVAPAEGNRPLPILKEEKLEAKAFPALFPEAKNTLDSQRPVRLTPRKYFNSRLLNADTRFAFDTNYIFFAQYMIELHQVISSISIALRKSSPVLSDGRTLNARMLTNRDEVRHLLKSDEGFRFLQPVRGTPAYWQRTMRDLFATLRQIGCPTFFFTFSCADLRWPEVIETIMRQQGKVVKLSDMTWSEKCDALRSNPVTAVRMFDHRIRAFLRDVIYSPAQPIGKVTDHFYRLEFQSRGSGHIHGLVWVEDAPKLDENTDEEVCAFVDKYISCQLPSEEDEELRKIVMEVQMHRKGHSPTCKKGKKTCRFNFPRPPSERTYISRPEDQTDDGEDANSSTMTEKEAKKLLSEVFTHIASNSQPAPLEEILAEMSSSIEEYEAASQVLTKRKTVVLKRSTSDCWVNNYNKDLLRIHNANMDIQYIDNPYQCIMYIVNYISKAETELGEFLKEASKQAKDGNKTILEEMRSVSQAYFENREVSAQEAVSRACSLPMKAFSREVVFVPTSENSTRMSLPLQQLKRKAKEDTDDENVWMTNIVERYLARPEGEQFEKMCLATFASEYRVLYTCSKKSLDSGKAYALKNDLGYIQKRTRSKPAVIRYPRFSRDKNPEKFHCTILTLYLPHRNKDQLKPTGFDTYESFFLQGSIRLHHDSGITAVRSIVQNNRSHFEKDVDAIDHALDELQQNGPAEDAWGRIAAETERERLEAEAERHESTLQDDDEELFLPELPDLQAQSVIQDAGNPASSAYPPKETEVQQREELKKVLQSLNTMQRGVFNTIRQWCIEKTTGQNPKPFHIFLSGGAGTGKSHLIKAVQYEANRLLRQASYNAEETKVLLTAPTGTAAFNIGGSTIHSALKIPMRLKPQYEPLGEECLNTLRSKLEEIDILIIDEISMVPSKLMCYIHGRLKQIKQVRDMESWFGNVSVLAVGDFYQLPPVGSHTLLSPNNIIDPWNGTFVHVELTEIMRQKDDKSFAELLNRVRVSGKKESLLPEDLAILQSCCRSAEQCPADVLHIFAKNKDVDKYNDAMLSRTNQQPVLLQAEDIVKDPRTGQQKRRTTPYKTTEGLQDEIRLSVGARVILTRNIDLQSGLVNGAFGTVTYIASPPAENRLPSYLAVKFDNKKINQKAGSQNSTNSAARGSVIIKPIEEKMLSRDVTRRQFPLKLAWATTIHKVQGMTCDKIAVSLEGIFKPGMAYVALSRVTSLSGLHIMDFDPSAIYCDADVKEALSAMPTLDISQQQPLLHQVPMQPHPSLTVVHHNIQGVLPHLKDFKCNPEMTLADIVCLTETWLKPEQTINLPTRYDLHRQDRCVTYEGMPDRQQQHGGVAILSHKSLKAHPVKYRGPKLEYACVNCPDYNITIASVYRPPSYKMETFLTHMRELVACIEANISGQGIVIMGDFNENPLNYAHPLCDLMAQHGYRQIIDKPTTEKATLLDLAFVKHIPEDCPAGVLHTYYSYHDPIYLQVLPNKT